MAAQVTFRIRRPDRLDAYTQRGGAGPRSSSGMEEHPLTRRPSTALAGGQAVVHILLLDPREVFFVVVVQILGNSELIAVLVHKLLQSAGSRSFVIHSRLPCGLRFSVVA